MTVELFQNKQEHFFIIKDGDRVLKLSEDQFNDMKADGKSPLLKKLWDDAKKEREAMDIPPL